MVHYASKLGTPQNSHILEILTLEDKHNDWKNNLFLLFTGPKRIFKDW